MPLPEYDNEGYLPPGIHTASLNQALARFGVGSAARQRQAELLRLVVEAAKNYSTIKRVLVWGSFITAKLEPGDLDYSVVVSVDHKRVEIPEPHRRFFMSAYARMHYGIDRGYLIIEDYPLDTYVELMDFICQRKDGLACGVVEISLRGEITGDEP